MNQSQASTLPPAVPGSGGSILLVDDDPAVRMYCQRVLELHGWHVLAAGSGADAVQIASAHASPIHLLITDVMMPGQNGRELADHLQQIQPGLKVLFISGYHADQVLQMGINADQVQLLHKPFLPDGLIIKVREVLSS